MRALGFEVLRALFLASITALCDSGKRAVVWGRTSGSKLSCSCRRKLAQVS